MAPAGTVAPTSVKSAAVHSAPKECDVVYFWGADDPSTGYLSHFFQAPLHDPQRHTVAQRTHSPPKPKRRRTIQTHACPNTHVCTYPNKHAENAPSHIFGRPNGQRGARPASLVDGYYPGTASHAAISPQIFADQIESGAYAYMVRLERDVIERDRTVVNMRVQETQTKVGT